MWRLTVRICNTPTYTYIRKRKVSITSCSTALWSCPWAWKQRKPPDTHSTCSPTWGITPALEPQGITCTWDTLTPLAHRQRNKNLLCFPMCTSWVFQCRLVTSSWCGKWSHNCLATQPLPRFGALQCILAKIFLAWGQPNAACLQQQWAGLHYEEG